jgi:UDP-N-acetylmuramyl pentapeptide phosphotransferase/UDP-N-acetylglucosamine-1-phosphate transferase
MTGPQAITAAGIAAGSAFATCLAIVLTQRWHGHYTLDDTQGIQKTHVSPTPRVGGVGVLFGLLLGSASLDNAAAQMLAMLLLAGLPAFLAGFGEDLTGRVSVRIRLLATMASGAIAWWILGAELRRIDVFGVDLLLAWAPASLLFTAFAVGGVANAINIIDGFNGLASGILLIAMAALGTLAAGAGDPQVAVLCLVVGAAVLGFGLINFPGGRIFLGDGGAYLLGYLLAVLSVLVAVRNPGVSPWAPLMACAYPILEVLFSVLRRVRRRHSPGHPDRLHLHSLLQRRVVRKVWPVLHPTLLNASVSPLVWVLAAAPALVGVVFYDQTPVLMLSFASFAFLYGLAYWRLINFRGVPGLRRGRVSGALADH